MKVEAKWIWPNFTDVKKYNQAAVFIRSFSVASFKSAKIAITADSWYRLKVNGEWVNDGPCRNYPNHYQYDVIDLGGLLIEGVNHVEVVARYFGIGTAHQIPQQAGLLAQVEIVSDRDETIIIPTDRSWLCALLPALKANTARLSIKQEPAEIYDARLTSSELSPAVELFEAKDGPWSGLHERDCRLLSKDAVTFTGFIHERTITSKVWSLSIPAQKLLHPGLNTTNFSTSLSCGAAFRVTSHGKSMHKVLYENLNIFVNGRLQNPAADLSGSCQVCFQDDDNLLVLLAKYPFENQTDLSVAIVNPDDLSIMNPNGEDTSTVCFLTFPELFWESSEIPRHMWANHELLRRQSEATDILARVGATGTWRELSIVAGHRMTNLHRNELSDDDAHWEFRAREVAIRPQSSVLHPENLMTTNHEWTEINSEGREDLELLYDLGEQQCGYFEFEIIAEEGVVLDVFAVEYINEHGTVQHTDDVRNGLRYICKSGVNTYTSLKRRSGRFVFVTLRNLLGPVRIRFVRLISATYPVLRSGSFHSSDATLNKVWEISARTVKLCMEDVYTDCPCYEQSLWLGDARNIALFSFPLYAPWDLARRCIRLGGYSLDRYPIAGSQVPSGWDCLIPAWSFLWGASVWDYYEETADAAFLEEVFPMVLKNIQGGMSHIDDESGLFEMYTWNLFEWVETDTHQPRMVYDSMLLSAAISAAIKCGRAIARHADVQMLECFLATLNAAINRTWDPAAQGYPDSYRKSSDRLVQGLPANLAPCDIAEKYSGPCREYSVHTSMLGVLYDIVDEKNRIQAARNVLTPTSELIKVRNMFAKFYLYQTMEKLGHASELMALMIEDYKPMLERDSTTTWENFALSGEFPCRSHSHAWSAGALYFIYRLTLGLQICEPGGTRFHVSPEIGDMCFAEGSRATAKGPIWLRWERNGSVVKIHSRTPPGIELSFQTNRSLKGLEVILNGTQVQTGVSACENLDKVHLETQNNAQSENLPILGNPL